MKKTKVKKEYDFLDHLESELDEGKMAELHKHIKDGKSAKEIAKIMKVDEKTIQKLMSGFNEETDAQVKSYIDDIALQMAKPAHRNLAKFADAFKKHAYKTMNPRKSLDAVLPSSVKDKQKANLLNMGEAWEIGTDEYREYLEKLTPGEKREVEEASARADAKRHMRKDREVDPADVDTDASDEDIKAASKHIIMQMRKVISLKGNFKVEFGDKKKVKIPVKIAQAVIQKYNTLKKPAEKEKFQTKVAKSHRDMLMVLKAGYNESTDTVLGRIDKKLKERKNG
jgi:hypothetical protein